LSWKRAIDSVASMISGSGPSTATTSATSRSGSHVEGGALGGGAAVVLATGALGADEAIGLGCVAGARAQESASHATATAAGARCVPLRVLIGVIVVIVAALALAGPIRGTRAATLRRQRIRWP